MNWLHEHRLALGAFTDSITFIGGAILARDAFRRLKDLKEKRIDKAFRSQFPRLNLTDDEWNAAIVSMRWTVAGFLLIVIGFSCQILLRFLEP